MPNYAFYSLEFPQKKENIYYHRRINTDWPEKHKCSYWEFLVVDNGVLLNCINNRINILYGNDIAWVRPDDLHDILSREGASFEFTNIMIEDCWVKTILDYIDTEIYEKLKAKKYLQYSFTKEFIVEIEEAIKEADKLKEDKDKQLILKPLVLKLISEFVKRSNEEHPSDNEQIVRKAIRLMQKDMHLDIKQLSKKMNYSQGYLTRCFKKTCKMSPNMVFQQIKLNYARNLLETTNISIAAVAQEIEMSGIGYFNKKYKEQFGVLPSEYRRKLKKDADAYQQIEALL